MARTLCPVVVGRERELEALDAARQALEGGQGTCLVITGEAGIGKSRLIRELAAGAAGVPVAVGRAVPSGWTEPYRPLTEALLQLLRGRPITGDPEMDPWRVSLAALLPNLVPVEGQGPQGITAPVRAEAVRQLLRRSAPDGVIVIVEDLHWADLDTLTLVECLAEHAADDPVILALTSREEPGTACLEMIRRLWGRNGVVHLALTRLTPHETAAMVAACLPDGHGEHRRAERVQRSAEGIPLLVEELLASPGLPESVAETVVARLKELEPEHRRVLESAAALGRQFDWELLPRATGLTTDTVAAALAAGVERQLLSVEADTFRFRHALTRDAVAGAMLPPQRRAVAAAALAAIDRAHPDLPGSLSEVAADLAVEAGERQRAGVLLLSTGRRALQRGAIDTAVEALYRAVAQLAGRAEEATARLALMEALAMAGRVDEAAAAGQSIIGGDGATRADPESVLRAHLQLAQAAVSAARWTTARRHLEAASELAIAGPPGDAAATLALLFSEVALAGGRLDEASTRAEEALNVTGPEEPEVRCHAFELLGRACRLQDPSRARGFFEEGLAAADAAGLPHWRLRALQEVGTIDMFDHAGVRRLIEARRQAEQAGAVTTAASLDLQLAACYTARWELDRCDDHARLALERAERFQLEVVHAKALGLLSCSASMRGDPDETERYARLARAVTPDDQWLHGFSLINRGMALLTAGEIEEAAPAVAEGTAMINRVPHGEPAAARLLWPLLLAHRGDRRAATAAEEARRLGLAAFRLNQGLLAYAEAMVAGRAGDPVRAERMIAAADHTFANCEPWLHLARVLAAGPATMDGWGDPAGWASAAASELRRLGLGGLAARAEAIAPGSPANPWAGSGITDREAQVLRLVAEGRPNKQVATELGLSVRTVEKHVESLLRKTGARSRTELALRAAGT